VWAAKFYLHTKFDSKGVKWGSHMLKTLVPGTCIRHLHLIEHMQLYSVQVCGTSCLYKFFASVCYHFIPKKLVPWKALNSLDVSACIQTAAIRCWTRRSPEGHLWRACFLRPRLRRCLRHLLPWHDVRNRLPALGRSIAHKPYLEKCFKKPRFLKFFLKTSEVRILGSLGFFHFVAILYRSYIQNFIFYM